MAYEQRDNSGTLFVNDHKETDRHPDRTGAVMVGGVMYRVAAWTKTPNRGGNQFWSLSFTVQEERDGGQDQITNDNEEPPF